MPDGSEKEKRPQTQRKGRSEACRFVPAGEIIPCLHPACGFTPDLRIALRLSSPARCLRIYALPISGLQICTPFTPACEFALRLQTGCKPAANQDSRSDRSDRPETDELSTVNNHGRFRVRLQITILIPSRMAGLDPVPNHKLRFQHRNDWPGSGFKLQIFIPSRMAGPDPVSNHRF